VAGYNPIRVSEEFRQWAELAEAVLRADESRISVDRNAVKRHDELLAGLVVYRYLQDGHFLSTPELLLCELRLLRANALPRAPQQVLNLVNFVAQRSQLIDTLIARFQGVVNFRDAIGAGDAPPPSPRPAAPAGRRRHTPMPPTRKPG
jgi:hypothetical protein